MADGWEVKDDQSATSGADFRASDLQIAEVTLTSTEGVTSGSASMKHKMGLVEPYPTTKSVVGKLTYTYYQGDGGYTETTSGTATVTASNAFTGKKPLLNNSRYYYIVQSTSASDNIEVSFTCDEQQTDFWSAKASGTDIGYGKYKQLPIQSDRTAASFEALFSCQRTVQQVTLPWYGTYKIECWGGGYNPASSINVNPSYGGYTCGDIELRKAQLLYVYVGSKSVDASTSNIFGGGGYSIIGPSGAGATDVRMANNNLQSRIIVAGGAGGLSSGPSGSSAGGCVGYAGDHTSLPGCDGKGGAQTYGGAAPTKYSGALSNGSGGTFGNGGYGGKNGGDGKYGSGGGGGWFGGSGGSGADSGHFNGGGGSSFISGHSGCTGVNSSATALGTEGTTKPSTILVDGIETEITMSNSKMIDGRGYKWTSYNSKVLEHMPNPSGGYYSSGVGHSGDGYAKITSL